MSPASSPANPLATHADVALSMRRVLLALLPAGLLHSWLFGWGLVINLLLCGATALASEALFLRWRQRDWRSALGDYSALLSASLLAFSLPPLAPWWLPVFGAIIAIGLGKHIYGGLGQNPFNPAMLAYVVLLVSWPASMSQWLQSDALIPQTFSWLASWQSVLFNQAPGGYSWDAITHATLLDRWRQPEHAATLLFDSQAQAVALLNGAYLLGGLYLLWRGVIRWHIPVAVLTGLLLPASLAAILADTATALSPWLHLSSGACMLGAFFIATDPVTAATSPRGRLIYGLGIGLLTYAIRRWGGYPDGFAFAVLLMNLAAPSIDHFTKPRIYGH